MTISHSILAAAKAETASGTAETKLASEPKLCKDCRHADAKAGVWFCSHPELLRMDLVSGNHQPEHCVTLRAPRPIPQLYPMCGREGSGWEAK